MNIFNLFKKVFPALLLILSFSSCSKKIPDGDIKDFVDKLNYKDAYDFVNTASSQTIVKHYVNSQVDGSLQMDIQIDKKEYKYRYSESIVDGFFHGTGEGQYFFNNQKTLCYMHDDNVVNAYQLTDNVNDNIKYSPDDVLLSIKNFFYTQLDSNIYRGGFYYGDYIKINCARYYENFSLNDSKDELTYSINTVTQDDDNTDILNMHSFTVNSYGMLLKLNSIAKNNSKKIKSETTTYITYNSDFIHFDKL